jgi:hypothetical protein
MRFRMDAELTVELEASDPTLAIPWSSDDGRLRYYDLKLHPDLLLYVDEASRYPELAEFLVQINSAKSVLQSAKCDAWYSTEISEPEEIYGAEGKFVSYIDVFFFPEEHRFSFDYHEEFAHRLVQLLGRAPQISAAAEFIIRRCYFAASGADLSSVQKDEYQEGFYFTFYLSAYGDDEPDARKRWGIALKLTGYAILQLSSNQGHKSEPGSNLPAS